MLIAFGDTRLTDIEGTRIEFLEEQSGGDSPCKGDLRAGEPRELTDAPRTGFTDISDISRIYPREEFTVLARTAARDAYLVRSRHDFTGWLSARDIVLFSDSCEGRGWTTPVVDRGYLVAERERPHVIKRAYRMTMRNTELTTPDMAFADLQRARGYPTSGLLVLNPTDQKVAMEINGIEILLASSMYLRDVNGVTTILVLEGQVNATRNGHQFSGRAGQTLWIGPGGENLDTLMRRVPLPARQQVAAPWCGWLERIAKAAFRERVPPAQIAFCAYAPQSYGYVPFFPGRAIDRPSGRIIDRPSGPVIDTPLRVTPDVSEEIFEAPEDPIEPSPCTGDRHPGMTSATKADT